jgi:hypothetical protein
MDVFSRMYIILSLTKELIQFCFLKVPNYHSPVSLYSTVAQGYLNLDTFSEDRLCGLVVRVLGYRFGGPCSIPGTTRKKSSGSGTGSTQPREYN